MRFTKLLFCLVSMQLFAGESFIVDIPNAGQIRYDYEKGNLVRIARLSLAGEELYSYTYDGNDLCNAIDQTAPEFTQPDLQLEFDDSGDLIRKEDMTFSYDEHHRLVHAITPDCEVLFTYDAEGKRTSKTVRRDGKEETEISFYLGSNEIALYTPDGKLKQLRIPGPTYHKDIVRPVAIEIGEDVYTTILDLQGNIVKLIHRETQEEISYSELDAFGSNIKDLSPITPWIFANKHYDEETGLVYFGHRYYDPELKQWTTPDPIGTLQSDNLYLYCFNNPLKYTDPDGRFAFVIPIVIWGSAALTEVLIDAAIVAGASYLGYEAVKLGNELMEASKSKEGKQKDGTPKNNQAQNDQIEGAIKDIEKKIGRRLEKKEKERLHRHVSGQGYGYHEIVEDGIEMFLL